MRYTILNHNHIKLYAFLCIVLSIPMAVHAGIFSLEQENQNVLTVKFQLPEYSIQNVDVNGTRWQKIVSDDGSVYGQEGFPELRNYSTAIAVPVDGDFSFSIENSESNVTPNINLIPSSKLTLDGDEPGYLSAPGFVAYGNSELYPLQICEKGESAFVGNRKFIPLTIYPFQYRAGSKELVTYDQITINITIHGTKTASKNWQLSPNPLDAESAEFFLNDSSSKGWRLEKQRNSSVTYPKNGVDGVNEIQLIIDSEGLYKIDYQYLMNMITLMADSLQITMNWTPASVDPRYLELTDEFGQVPIHFVGENDASFDPGDYFEFYGDKHNGDTGYMDDYTSENVYTLSLKDNYGARMVVENGGLIVSNIPSNRIPDAYEETVHFEQQYVSDKLGKGWSSSNPNYFREDLWFWKKISAPNLEIIPIELQYPKDTTIRTASAKVSLMGLTYAETLTSGQYDHEASVRLNQAMINTHTWIGQTEKIFSNQSPIPNTFLKHGTNNLYVSLSGSTVMSDREQVMLDYATVTYWREYKTDLDYIKFTKPSNVSNGLFQFELKGFTTPDISVYKIGSSVFNNVQIEPFNLEGIPPWTVTIQDSVSSIAVRYFAVSEAMKKTPKSARLNVPSNLVDPLNSANVVVITVKDFMEAEGTLQLKSIWENDGHSVKVIDVQDIYDEFNYGIVGAEPIKAFISYAYNNWSEPQVTNVIFLGEGVDDTRDNSPARIYNLVPVKKLWTNKHGATASDNWYACIIGSDSVPDISIARIGVWNSQQILDYAAKAGSYRTNLQTNRLWNSHLTFTSGGKITDPNDIFAQQSERIRRKSVPKDYRVTRVYTATQQVSSEYSGGTFDLKDAINNGTQYVQFMGHGGGRVWADYNLFNFNDVTTLNNTTYPIVISLACYASAFDTMGSSSLSEALILKASKGAIGAGGFSGLGYLDQDEGWGLAYTEALFRSNFANIGQATIFALAKFFTNTSSSAARLALTNGYVYLGDPLIKPKKPIVNIPVSAENHTLVPGETLNVHAQFPASVTSAKLIIMKDNEIAVNVPFDLPVSLDGSYTGTYTNSNPNATNYTRKIYLAGYSPTDEYIGRSVFSVGRATAIHVSLSPSEPAWTDSVKFSAKAFSNALVTQMVCKVRTDSLGSTINWVTLPMQKSAADTTMFVTTAKLAAQRSGKEIFYKYVLSTQDGSAESFLESYMVRGPDLLLSDIKLEQEGNNLVLKVRGTNIGSAASITTDLRLYAGTTQENLLLINAQPYLPLAVGEVRWDSFNLTNLQHANLILEVRVNSSQVFFETETYFSNNIINMQVPFNYFVVDNNPISIASIDANLTCDIPAGFVSQGSQAIFSINSLAVLSPYNQPDVNPIKLRIPEGITGNDMSIPYEVLVTGTGISDSLGVFLGGKRVSLTYHYSATDSLNHLLENGNTFKIYRYNPTFKKWILKGGYVNVTQNTVSFEVNRTGIYSVFHCADTSVPTIDVNVQDQEFTVGGYIAGNGVISLLLSDANGIDVIDNSIRVYLNGVEVPEADYVISVNLENINRVPIKYQLSLGRGNHELKVDCRDLNGYFNSREIQFVVNDKFDIINLANYPNPVLGKAQDPKNDSRTRFTYVLTDGADEVTIKVYTVSGRLVKTFKNLPIGVGYHEYPRTVYGWDCKDDLGYGLANGVYFYRIIARKGNKSIEKTQKMAILK